MKPILFNTEMVQAILAGRKTVTRRVVKPQPEGQPTRMLPGSSWPGCFAINGTNKVIKPPYQIGDILYVRETWAHPSLSEVNAGADPEKYLYKADSPLQPCAWGRWHPSIHMPKEAARIFLRVKNVRVERLKEISSDQAMDEGFTDWDDFTRVWNSTIKKADLPRYGWNTNPWVWVIEFERISKEEAQK